MSVKHLEMFGLTVSKIAQGKYALLDEESADNFESAGDQVIAEKRRRSADLAWASVFDHLGDAGDEHSHRRVR
jgi:hypothetical protein